MIMHALVLESLFSWIFYSAV